MAYKCNENELFLLSSVPRKEAKLFKENCIHFCLNRTKGDVDLEESDGFLGFLIPSMNPLDRPYLQLVRRRNAARLLPIIQRNVQPGSLVYTDEWAAYRRMQRVLGFNHLTVNHSVNFVDPVTGVYTQHAESNWSVAKAKLKKMSGNTNPNSLQEYHKEFMWRRWHGEPHLNGSFGRLVQDIAEQYPL